MKRNSRIPQLQQIKEFLAVNVWVQQFRLKAFGWWYYVDLLYKIADKISDVLDAFLIGLIINQAVILAQSIEKDFTNIQLLAILYVAQMLLRRLIGAFYWRFSWYKNDFGFSTYLDEQVNKKLAELNWEHIENPKTEKLINQVSMRSEGNMRRLASVHIDIVSIIISTIFALAATSISWWIVLIIFLKELPSIILHSSYMKKNFILNDEVQYTFVKKGQISGFYRSFTTLLEIKVSQAYKKLATIYSEAIVKIRSTFLDLDKKTLLPDSLIAVFESLINAGVFGYYVFQLIFNSMPLGTFQYTTSIIRNIGNNFYELLRNLNSTVEHYRYSKFAYDLLHMQNTVPNGNKKLNTDNLKIEFKDVWFRYSHSKKYALKRINVTIEDNDRIALVGENGAGKSTFLKLLTLLYYPTKGQILINDIDLKEYDKESLYKKLAVVTQDFARYGVLTVAQNISIFGDSAKIDITKVKEAAKLAVADDFIEKLSLKYDTYLTKKMEDGTELSTGQWQRIAVARQFYGNRPLIILDEPTASIDPIAEGKIFYNLYHHVKDKTVIVVSHRYNTVRAAKQILVFNSGEIIERGTHAELLEKQGYYAQAFNAQQEEKEL